MKSVWKAARAVRPPLSGRSRHSRRIAKTFALGTTAIAGSAALVYAQSDNYVSRAQVVSVSDVCPVVLVNFSTPLTLASQNLSGDGKSLSIQLSMPAGAPASSAEPEGPETLPDLGLADLGSAQMVLDATGPSPVLRLSFSNPVAAQATQSGVRSIVISLSTVGDTNDCFQPVEDDTAATATPSDEPATEGETAEIVPPEGTVEVGEAAALLTEARAAITAEDYPQAVRLLTKLLELPENPASADTQELLGVVRERNGQMAHATAEYEIYLDKYPEGPGADRVRQRLAAILTSQAALPPALREAGDGPALAARVVDGVVQEPPQITSIPRTEDTFRPLGPQPGFRGDGDVAFAEEEDNFQAFVTGFYYLNQASSVFEEFETDTVDSDDELLQHAFVVGFDASDERKIGENTFVWRVNGDYEFDLADSTNSGLNLSRLYAGVTFENGAEVTFGRQTEYDHGILGRFDGLSASQPFGEDFVANGVVGRTVDSSSDMLFSGNRTVIGSSVDYLGFGEDTELSGYVVGEFREGYRDRFALGLEGSYFDERDAIFGAIEYAPDFGRLNNVRFSWTRQVGEGSSVSASIDYRQSPFLSLSAGLQGQTATTLGELANSFSLAQMETLALDRSSEITSATFGYQRQLDETWLASTDATFTYTTGNPASGGVAAVPAPGFEMYASAQLTGSGIVLDNDAVNVAARYANTASSELFLVDGYWRFEATEKLRLKPRVRVAHRQLTSTGGYENLATPSLTFYYEMTDSMDLELEAGDRFTIRNTPGTRETTNEFFLFAGVSQEF